MRVIILIALLGLFVLVSAKENEMLLGADDVDKKHAEMTADDTQPQPEAPQTIHDIKRKAKDDRRALREMQSRARALKHQLKDAKPGEVPLSKSEVKSLKRQYAVLKNTMKSKKLEISELKKEIQLKKGEKRRGSKGRKGSRRGGRKRPEMTGMEEKKINSPESFGLKADSETKPEQEILLTKAQKKQQRKESRRGKGGRRRNKNKGGSDLAGDMKDQMSGGKMGRKLRTSLDDVVPKRGRGRKRGRKHKVRCDTDADCTEGFCKTNHKGQRFCRRHRMDKPAGKKCHRSEQCMRGLQCYVLNIKALTSTNPKGVCADPDTADLSVGKFIPYKN